MSLNMQTKKNTMLTEEKINLNFVKFVNKLKQYNCYPKPLEDDIEFNNLLKNSSAFLMEDSGGAYEGSLVEHVTNIAVMAFKINDNILAKEVQVPIDSLIRICYLHQISKALMFLKNDKDYEIKKGKLFKFNDNIPAMKCGEYSLFLCNKYGITLSSEEFEAILSVDKPNDDQIKYFGGILSLILREANNLANSERKIRYEYYKNTLV